MDRTRWIIFGVIVLAAIAGLFALSKGDNIDVSNVDPSKVITEGQYKDNIYGDSDAKVALIEYGDFQCSGCASAYPMVKSLKEKYKDSITFVYRHFPLTNIHPNALAAATAAEAAGKQGKFWEMHDILFERQSSWQSVSVDNRDEVFESYAKEIGLDIDRYNSDLTSEEVADKVAFHRALAGKVGANSTPTFVLNGRTLENDEWNSEDALEKSITDALKKAGVEIKTEQSDATETNQEAQTTPQQ